jgi:type I site-specific restriction-modification system R (restriction) subunit
MPHAYTEDQLVEQPAIGLFAELGWATVSALEETFGTPSPGLAATLSHPMGEGASLGRETKGEVVLVSRLRVALERLNPALPPEAITAAVDELTHDRSAMGLPAANLEVYRLLKDGIAVSVADPEAPPSSFAPSPQPSPKGRGSGGQRTERVRVIDWENPAANDFLLVSQFSVTGALYTCRPDLVGFVNGLPLVVTEFKKPGVPARAAFDENLTHYKQQIPALFWYNALLIASNGTDSRVGSLTADWGRFFEWKRIEREDEPRRVSLDTMIRGTCEPSRLLDLVENFTLFSEHKAGLVKIIGQNHQVLGVNNTLASMLVARRAGHGRGGVFWQTQGSGKSYSMVFFAQKVLRKIPGNWTFVIATDRVELDDQIAKTFKATGAVSEVEGDQCHAASGAHLRELLRGNHRYVFTLIHKFRPETPSSPALLPGGEGSSPLPVGEGRRGEGAQQYRGGLQYSGLVERARELRKSQTPAEDIAWELLRDRRFAGLKFRRQHQVGHYIADFFCAEDQLDIELDGEVHKSPEVEKKDATRDKMLRSLGFKVLRFQNQLVLDQPDEFLRQIAAALELPSTLGRRAGDEGHMPVLCDRPDVIVLADEAHRSQYDTLALNMRAALPRALFIAFTGTPLIVGEERTKEVFGDYVSIYDFQQSVEDGATVPLFYENRTPELQLVNPDLNEDIYSLIEAAELDPEQEAKLERELSRQYHILTRDDRLETVARDIVRHFLGRGFVGKAMVVSIDKATALKMHDKVRKHWAVERERVEKELGRYGLPADKKDELLDRLRILQTTDMALIVSPGQNEIGQMQKHGLDIVPHRKRMNESQPPLDEKFKDPEDPLRLVFVCAMWMTGFDAPSCSTMYLDKPLRNHTLMQTIARANRVFPGKHSGVIVDYANVFASLEKALAIYGAGKDGKNPVRDKQKLVEELRHAVDAAVLFCANRGVVLAAIEQLPVGSMERLQRMDEAVNALISPDPLRREYFSHERLVSTLYGAVKPDPTALEFAGRVACIAAIADAIRTKLNPNPADITEVMGDIGKLLDASITGVGMPAKPAPVMDLSKIDFEALRCRFKESKQKNTDLEVLKAAIRAQLEKLIRLNKTRADFAEKFEELIEAYNSGNKNIEDLFAFIQSLNAEQTRHVRENMTEEELVIFDILTRPAPDLSAGERAEVKKVAKLLLERIKALLVLDWRKRQTSRACVEDAIKDVLDTGLPRVYSPELYQKKCSAVFEHVYESYPEQDANIYAVVN